MFKLVHSSILLKLRFFAKAWGDEGILQAGGPRGDRLEFYTATMPGAGAVATSCFNWPHTKRKDRCLRLLMLMCWIRCGENRSEVSKILWTASAVTVVEARAFWDLWWVNSPFDVSKKKVTLTLLPTSLEKLTVKQNTADEDTRPTWRSINFFLIKLISFIASTTLAIRCAALWKA